MRIIVGALWLVVFLVLFAFAVNNTAVTDLHFFMGLGLRAPLIALLLAFFIAGFAFGMIALLPAWVRQRVELRRLRRGARLPVDATTVTNAPATRSYVSPAPSLETTEVMQTVARGARTTR
jgi:uncharacterized integral membrane protein